MTRNASWSRSRPCWANNTTTVRSGSALVSSEKTSQVIPVGFLAELLHKDRDAGRGPREFDFWLGSADGKPFLRGAVDIAGQRVIFPIENGPDAFKLIIKVVERPELLEGPPLGRVNFFFEGPPEPTCKPGISAP